MTYDWIAALASIATLVALTVVSRFLVFKMPAFEAMRELNHEVDRTKLARDRFKEAVKKNNRAGLLTNVFFWIVVMPFCLTLQAKPLWRELIDIVAVLLVFDFFYYWTHRSLFHGSLLRKVHALHHEARKPTYIDALYVHPLETCIGLTLFMGSIPLVAAITGGPLNAFSMAVATLLFTQLNTINHTYVNVPGFPGKAVSWITQIHAAHHVDMNQGNFATLTMLYDWAFGTLEEPVRRPTA